MSYKWMNKYTGEVHKTFIGAIISATKDIIHYPKCRTIEMFRIGKANK